MKRIEAVVRHDKLSEVKLALATVPHLGLTAYDVTEQDAHGGQVLRYRGTSRVVDMAPRAGVSVLVDDSDASAAVDAIAAAAHTGHEGDGTIVVVSVDEVVQISHVAAVA